MSAFYTYSFEDTTVTISHPAIGSYSAYGTGIGQVTLSMSNDITMHDVAADMAVVVSKIPKNNGTVNFEVLQSSDFNVWLKKFYNYLMNSDTSQFALATIVITNSSTGDHYTCTGVSPQKMPDNNFQSQAQNRTWTMMCAHIDTK